MRKTKRPPPPSPRGRAPTIAEMDAALRELEAAGLIEVDWQAIDAQTDTPPEHRRLHIQLKYPRGGRP